MTPHSTSPSLIGRWAFTPESQTQCSKLNSDAPNQYTLSPVSFIVLPTSLQFSQPQRSGETHFLIFGSIHSHKIQ